MSDAVDVTPDRDRCHALTREIAAAVKAHYLSRPGDIRNVFEVLNALACVTAMTAAGTAPDGIEGALSFFGDAMTLQLNDTLAAIRGRAKGEGLH